MARTKFNNVPIMQKEKMEVMWCKFMAKGHSRETPEYKTFCDF